jgi:DNA-binding winged helix-turn-helix (wHTH) protein
MHTGEISRFESPPFPRPVNGFVGREAELSRARALLPRETLFLVYGVAGIGKSEFVYKVVEEARALPSFRRAATISLSARAERRCEHLVSILRLRLGADPEPHAGLADDLNAVARVLEARPTLVFIDDVHNLDAETVAEVLGYLARHVSRSRIFVGSRLEVLLPAGTPPPVICRLQPLSREATAALVEGVSHTLGLSSPDPEAVFTRSGGSPFYVLRELSDLRYAPRRGDDPLAAALRDLAPPLRHTLLLARLLRRRLGPADLQGGEALWELARRFLIDIDRGVIIVHDLIGEALAREVSPQELDAARLDGARLLLRRAEAAPRDLAADPALDVMEAVLHLTAASEHKAAWEALERWHRLLACVALDHLALDILPALRAALPEQQQQVALRTARILVSHSRIDEARALLDELGAADAALARNVRYLRLSAEIALRTGALDRAAALLDQALSAAHDPRESLRVALQLACVQARRGDGEAARRGLLDAQRVHGAATLDDEGRLGWARALSFLTEGRLAEAGAAAAKAAACLSDGEQAEAERVQLAMLELISRCACDDLDAATALLRRIQRRESVTSARRAPTVTLYQGLLHHARGELPEARAALNQAHQYLSTHSDLLPAAIAGHYLGLTLLGLGDNEGAQAAAARTAQQVSDGGLLSLSPHCAVLSARVHLQALRLREMEAALAPSPAASGNAAPPWCTAQLEALQALLHALRGETDAARAALLRAAARARDDGTEARWRELDLAAAEVLLLCGDAAAARPLAEAAQAYYEARGRRYPQAQAALLHAAALVALQVPPELHDLHEYGGFEAKRDAPALSEAESHLALAQELAERHGYAQPWGPLVAAALWRRRGDERRARAELSTALRLSGGAGSWIDHAADTGDHLVWQVASLGLRGTEAETTGAGLAPPGLATLLRLLGLLPRAPVIADRSMHPAAPDAARRTTGDYDLVVDLGRNVILAPGREERVVSRPLLCALLACFTPAATVFSAERLFYDVWGGREYHPERHRNTIYVAITRLRRALQELLPGRQVVETTPHGWRLASDISMCVIPGNAGQQAG